MDSYQHHQQQNWYPSSSPPPPPPPPGGGGGGYHQLPSGYPPIPHHHQWPPPDSRHHPHPHQFQSPPPYGLSSAVPSPYSVPPPPSHLQQQQYPLPPRPQYPMPPPPPPPPPPQQMVHQHPPPPPSSAFPPQNQAWGNPSWGQHQGWAHPDRNIPYNNEEDWAARARAWAAAKSGTENHHTQPHFAPTGRADEHNYAYQDHYQQTFDARTDMEQHSRPQSSMQHLPITSSGSSSYSTGYRAGDEAITSDRDHMASPQKRYGASIYEQEVPYSYSSGPGKIEVFNQVEGSHVPMPLPMPSIQEGHHSLPSVPIQVSSAEQPHFANHGQPKDFLPDARDRPLEFEPRSSSDHESHQKLSYGHSGPTGVMGVVDHDMHVPPISSWSTATATATGAGYPQLPLGPSGTQFDASFIPHASLPVHPAPVFGRMPVPSFQHNMPHVSAPFGLGPGSSLNHSAAFPVDANGGLSLPERPKKAAVPNWLREEIIKKKAVISSTVPMQPTGSSLDCMGPEDSDKSLRGADQAESKSIYSTKSTEDEEDDEEDVEAARSAAINQEIKRVLTEVLLKVTDELFEEIATKVLNEDKLTVEVEENPVHVEQVSSPAAISTPKASARILVPVKRENNKVNGVAEDSSTSSPGGDILGLGNYASDASDDDGDDEMQKSSLLPSGKTAGTSHQPGNKDKLSEGDLRSEGNINNLDVATQNQSARLYEGNFMTDIGSPAASNLKYNKKASERVSSVYDETVLADSQKVDEFPVVNENPLQSNNILDGKNGRKQESTSAHENHDKLSGRGSRDRESRSNSCTIKNSLIMEVKDNTYKARGEISDGNDSVIHEGGKNLNGKMEKRENLKERDGGRISKRGTNEKESDSRRNSKHNSSKDDRKEIAKDKRERYKDGERKRDRGRDEEDRSTQTSKRSSRHTRRRSPSPSSRGKSRKNNSFSHGSASGDEPSDSSRKRKQQSLNSSLSPSPTKSRKRQVSRSPPSKHSHRRHSPYPSSERRRKRSRSISPIHRRRSTAHKHE